MRRVIELFTLLYCRGWYSTAINPNHLLHPCQRDAINVRGHQRPRDRGCHFRFRNSAFHGTAMAGQDPPSGPYHGTAMTGQDPPSGPLHGTAMAGQDPSKTPNQAGVL